VDGTGIEPEVVARTQVIDVARALPLGIILPLETSVLLTIAVKHFDASGLVKGLVAAAGGIGLLASPYVTALARKRGVPAMRMAATVSAVGAVGFVVAASGPLPLFVLGVIVAMAAVNSVLPLVTFTYQRNFPADERGRRVGRGMAAKVAVSAPFAVLIGAWLRDHLDQWWLVVLTGGIAMLLLTGLYRRMPTERLEPSVVHRMMPHVELLRTDRQLRATLIAWMFMGFGNLMLLPLRVEYLARPQYGIAADAAMITLLTVTIPSVMRFATTPLFGRLFDRISFFAARIVTNLLFALYVVAFFSGTSTLSLWIGSLALGVAAAGGDLMWMLWVTKFAPPDRVADYMGLHTFSTGIRAVSAPLLAFLVIERFSLGWVAVIAAAMMVVSSLVLVPEARAERRARAAAALPA
jgi:predicted MFS family arabinose efflux permease